MNKILTTPHNFWEKYQEKQRILENYRKKAIKEKIPVLKPEAGSFISFFCWLKKPKSILEIGCGCGYSSYFLIENLMQGSYIGIDLNKKRAEKAESFLAENFNTKNISIITGDALIVISEIDQKFDLVFIDGAKYQYPDYLQALMGKVKRHGYVIADNIFYLNRLPGTNLDKHHKNSGQGIKDYLQLIKNTNNFNSTIYNIGDGLSVSEVLL